MARTAAGETNKSEAIRSYRKANRKAKPREIAAALQEKGLDVNAQYVSVVLSNARKHKVKSGAGNGHVGAVRRGRPSGSASNGGINLADLKLAKKLMMSAGSVQQARKAIDTIAELLP